MMVLDLLLRVLLSNVLRRCSVNPCVSRVLCLVRLIIVRVCRLRRVGLRCGILGIVVINLFMCMLRY